MTVNTTNITSGPYTGNNLSDEYSYNFTVALKTQLSVYETTDLGVQTLLTVDVDYTVNDVGVAGGGTINRLGGNLPTNYVWYIRSNRLENQLTAFRSQGSFLPGIHEDQMDHITFLVQQLRDSLSRSFVLSDTIDIDGDFTIDETAVNRADKFLGFDTAGDLQVLNIDSQTIVIDAVFDTVTLMKAASLAVGLIARTRGYYTAGDGGGAVYLIVTPQAFDAYGDHELTNLNIAVLQGEFTAEKFGAKDDVSFDDEPAFTAAAARGKVIKLSDSTAYMLTSGVTCSSGARFICDGVATITLKTGTAAFNSVDFTESKNGLGVCVFLFSAVDDIGMEGVRFIADGTKDVVLYPIRVLAGTADKGCYFDRIEFKDIPATNGALLSLNSIGAGGYIVKNIKAIDCGTAQGNTYWTGTPQISVFETDNDLVGGVYSEPGYFENISAINVLLTSTALADYGQQTDCVNLAGINDGTATRRGPTGHGVYGDGVGEILDCFCPHSTVTGVRGRNAHNFGVKLIHGAEHCHIELDELEDWGSAAVTIQGSSAAAVDTQYNCVKVGTLKQTVSLNGFTESSAVLFGANGGVVNPTDNTVTIENVFGDGVDLDWIVRDGSADVSNNNFVTVEKATGWAQEFCDSPPGNVTAKYNQQKFVRATMSVTSAALVSAAETQIQYDTAALDIHSEHNNITDTIRPAFPGTKMVRAQVRLAGLAAGDEIVLNLKQNGVVIKASEFEASSGGPEKTYSVEGSIYIDEDDAGKAAADLIATVTVTTASSVTISNAVIESFFEVTPNV